MNLFVLFLREAFYVQQTVLQVSFLKYYLVPFFVTMSAFNKNWNIEKRALETKENQQSPRRLATLGNREGLASPQLSVREKQKTTSSFC